MLLNNCLFECTQVVSAAEGANTPRTNLSESKHGSWLAGEGHHNSISLYDACVSDMASALLQSAKQHAYTLGRHLGEGPSLETLINRSASRNPTLPREVLKTVQNVVSGTPMHHAPAGLDGDMDTVRRKRRPTVVVDVEQNSSHRPEFNFENVKRKNKGRPRKMDFPSTSSCSKPFEPCSSIDQSNTCTVGGEKVVEREIHNTFWAIRRTSHSSRVKCLGWLSRQGKCGNGISNCSKGVPAPSFWSTRTHPNGKTQQMMWFCNTDVTHTWQPEKSIYPIPNKIPSIWPVALGTNLTQIEADMLVRGGFQIETMPLQAGATKSHNFTGHIPGGVESSEPTPCTEPPATQKEGRRHKYRPGVSNAACVRIERAISMVARVTAVKARERHKLEIFQVETEGGQSYDVQIASHPACTCPDFQKRVMGVKPYLACKHIYFIFLRVMGLDQNTNMFIHQPMLSERDLFQALSRERTYP